MEEIPLVSVGVVTYNHENFIRDCVDSILAQSYGNIEIVISDDGSTDGTVDILQEYKRKNPHKLKLILSSVNQGITKNAKNLHFNCKGKYFSLVDGDDIISPEKISLQVEYMEKNHKCAISYHNFEIFDSKSCKTLGYAQNLKYAPHGGIETLFVKGLFNGSPSSMALKEKTPVNGFDERVSHSPDWLYWLETLANGGEIQYINLILGRYRRHGKNITVTEPTTSMMFEKMLTVLIITRKHPHLLKYYPALMKDILERLIHNYLKRPSGMILIPGKSMLRAYENPQ